jgi:hypothetical protein
MQSNFECKIPKKINQKKADTSLPNNILTAKAVSSITFINLQQIKPQKMKTADINTNLIDRYFTLLKSLSPDNKLELIAKLSKSMKTTKKSKDISWKSLFGALKIDQSAEDFVEDLKKDRKFSRKSIDL